MNTLQQPSSLRVLIVDDEAPVRMLVDRVLLKAGCVTRLAANGEEALQVARNFGPIDVLLTDMNMPEMNGAELARRLRGDDPSLKVLYFTGFSDRLFEDKGAMWEDEAFLEKPCTPQGILEAVSLLQTRNTAIGLLQFQEAEPVQGGAA